MGKQNIILLITVLIVGFAMLFGCVLLLLNMNNDEPITPPATEPTVEVPILDGDKIDGSTDIKDQIEEIDKAGFDSQTKYWIEKLKTVTDVEAALNKGLTIEYLCEKYFYDEYKEYKNTMMLGDDNNQEYPAEKVEELYQECIQYAQKFDFYNVIKRIDALLVDYKFTLPHNYKICNLYSDALALQHLAEMTSASKVECVSKLKTPELMLIAAVKLGYKEQCSMYTNQNSICMNVGSTVIIQNVEKLSINKNPTDADGKLMQKYFGSGSDLNVTKITFVVNFDLSKFEPSDFESYFETSEMVEVEDDAVYILDENGNVLHNLGRYSKEELEQLELNFPEYAEYIQKELSRRENKTNKPTDDEDNTEESDEDFVGMATPDEEDVKIYNTEAFERYKNTVYEIYIPEYETHNRVYNRIYKIVQVSNLDLPCCHTVYYYKQIYANNATFKNFVYKNQWSWNVDNEDLADEIAGDHAG